MHPTKRLIFVETKVAGKSVCMCVCECVLQKKSDGLDSGCVCDMLLMLLDYQNR